MDPSTGGTMKPRGARGCVGNGGTCGAPAMRGCDVCVAHGGKAPQVRKKALVRAELMAWGLTDQLLDPADTLLRLVAQSAQRVLRYSTLLEQAYDAAERLRESEGAMPTLRAELEATARMDLDRIFHGGGIGVLIGNTYSAAGKDGDIYTSGEAIRGLVELEAQERDRCAKFCKLAIDAGIEAKKVAIAQQQIAIMDNLLRTVLIRAGLNITDPHIQTIVIEELDRLPELAL